MAEKPRNSNKEEPMLELLSLAQYARRHGVNRSTVTRWKQAGLLVMRGEMVDATSSDPAIKQQLEAKNDPTFRSARVADLVYKAKLRQRELEERQKRLVEAASVNARWGAIQAAIQGELERWSSVGADGLAAVPEEKRVRDVLLQRCRILIGSLRRICIDARE